ncbi:Helix-turn-helix domain-containing protein [Pedococcus cremeus]|uniref:Helix-turn-helix domain-containing protein n=1 Tax=Pedococcus cremeus TaxID=587636 RepID=A0A1H9S7S7_9MICO|nr:helix-turn-helix transcriptional regulator [Pedococcus cremeus]SER80239.1 Helix-turn-helix domain-containing protein [Pedococcus cremeus]
MTEQGAGHRDEERFTANLRRLREAKGWSQNELATRMRGRGWESFRQTTVSRLEKGEQSVRIGEARALADLLGVTVDDMALTESAEAQAIAELRAAIEECTKALDRIDTYGQYLPQAQADVRRLIATTPNAPADLRAVAQSVLTADPLTTLTRALTIGQEIAGGGSDG